MICPHCGRSSTSGTTCEHCGNSMEFIRRTNYLSNGTSHNSVIIPPADEPGIVPPVPDVPPVPGKKEAPKKSALSVVMIVIAAVLLVVCLLETSLLGVILLISSRNEPDPVMEVINAVPTDSVSSTQQGSESETTAPETFEATAEATTEATAEPTDEPTTETKPETETEPVKIIFLLVPPKDIYLPETLWAPAPVVHSEALPSMSGFRDKLAGTWEFAGWNTRADGSGITFLPGQIIDLPLAEDVTLYSVWELQTQE